MARKVYWFESAFFLFFGIMHLSRIWGLFDRQGYANTWLNLMYGKGLLYYALMGIMALLCVVGIFAFIVNRGKNYWWRWVYIFGGGYILFDLFSILTGKKYWENLLLMMFNVSNPYWNAIWLIFILLGAFSFGIGIHLWGTTYRQCKNN